MSGRERVVLAVATLALGGVIGFFLGSSRSPSDVLVPGRPTFSRIAGEVNRLPSFPKIGQQCDAKQSTYLISFDYSNGDKLTVEVRPSPCGMVTLRGEDVPRADALNSAFLSDVTTLLTPH